MQDIQSLMMRSFSRACPQRTLPSSTSSPQSTGDSFDYWEHYFEPDNPIRLHDEAMGYYVHTNPTTGMRSVCIDIEELRRRNGSARTYPEALARQTFDQFKLSAYGDADRALAAKALNAARKYAEIFDQVIDQYHGAGLYFYSAARGSGKSFLASILGAELTRQGRRVQWCGMLELLQGIKDSYNRESGQSASGLIERYRSAEVLILDDIGVERQTPWVNETVFGILDARLSKELPTLFTSNLMPGQLEYDERVTDRIERMAEVVRLPEESVRKKLSRRNPLGRALGI